jgi:hypothetical protein
MNGVDALVADLARAGAPPAVRLAALAGEYNTWTYGDPERVPGPSWIAAAAAVRAYDLAADRADMLAALAPPPRPVAVPPPPRYNPAPPTDRQREVLAALRRLVDAGERVTIEALRYESGSLADRLVDALAALEGRGLIRRLPLGQYPPWIVLGPLAHLYPERIVYRTERSQTIEQHVRAGLSTDEVIAVMAAAPPVTRAEVYRVRHLYARDAPKKRTSWRPTGPMHAAVVEAYRAARKGTKKPVKTAIANALGISRIRVIQILKNAERLGDLA